MKPSHELEAASLPLTPRPFCIVLVCNTSRVAWDVNYLYVSPLSSARIFNIESGLAKYLFLKIQEIQKLERNENLPITKLFKKNKTFY